METIELFKWVNLNHVPGWAEKEGYALESTWSETGNAYFLPDSKKYEVPKGYIVGETMDGFKGLFEQDGGLVELVCHKGEPAIMVHPDKYLILKEVFS